MHPGPTTGHDSFARVYGSPGEGARLSGLTGILWPILVACGVAGYLLRATMPNPRMSPTVAGILMLSLAGTLALIIPGLQRRLQAFLKGARGEEAVAHALAFLPSGYTIFHSPASLPGIAAQLRSDCDHLILGPTGIFVIETKHWQGPGQIVDGRILYEGNEPERPPLDQVKHAAHETAKQLEQDPNLVHPIVCFAGDAFSGPPRGVMGVIICSTRDIVEVITSEGESPLSAERLREMENRIFGREGTGS